MLDNKLVGTFFLLNYESLDLIYLLQLPVGPLKQDTSDGSIVSKLLDKLMVVAFEHLESCQNDGRLDQVWHQMGPH